MPTAPGTIRSIIATDADTYKAFRVRCLQRDTTPAKVLGELVELWTRDAASSVPSPLAGQMDLADAGVVPGSTTAPRRRRAPKATGAAQTAPKRRRRTS